MKDLDIFGHKIKPAAAAAIGAGSLLAVYLAIRMRKGSTAAAAGTGATVTDPSTGQTYPADGVDPATGQTYSAEISGYGSVAAAQQALTGTGGGSPYGPGFGYTGPGTSNGGTTGGSTGYADNAAWAQAVEAGLTDLGYNPEAVGAALGRYLGSLSLTGSQATIVRTALAEYGSPPVGSYRVILQGTGPTGSGTTVTVPDVQGVDVEQATQILASAGLKAHGPAGAKGVVHVVTAQSPKAGSKVNSGTTVTLTTKTETENKLVVSSKPPIITPGRH